MITITDATRSIIQEDDTALQALAAGFLNLSAYAESIQQNVEDLTFKEVQKGSIVVALSRIAQEPQQNGTALKPMVQVDNLSIKSTLCSVTYDKSPLLRNKLASLQQVLHIPNHAFFTVTQSTSEITLILPQDLLPELEAHFGAEPKAVYKNQVGISVQFSEKYLSVPNVLYVLEAALAVHHINLTEVVSTLTEFCFIMDKEYLDIATRALKKFMK